MSLPVSDALDTLVDNDPNITKTEYVESTLRKALTERGLLKVPKWNSSQSSEGSILNIDGEVLAEVHRYSNYFVAMHTSSQGYIGSFDELSAARKATKSFLELVDF